MLFVCIMLTYFLPLTLQMPFVFGLLSEGQLYDCEGQLYGLQTLGISTYIKDNGIDFML